MDASVRDGLSGARPIAMVASSAKAGELEENALRLWTEKRCGERALRAPTPACELGKRSCRLRAAALRLETKLWADCRCGSIHAVGVPEREAAEVNARLGCLS
jgi:hypothetical protein